MEGAAASTLVGGQRQYAAVIVASMALFTDMFIYGLAIPVLPLLSATAGAGQAATGVLFAIYAAGMIAVTPLAGRLVDRQGTRMPLLVGMFGLAAATLLFAVGDSYWLLLVARGLQGVSAAMSWVAGLSLIAAATPLATRGRYMGLAMSTLMLGVLVGPPISGVIAAPYGPHAPFLVAIALAVVDGILRVVLVRSTPTSTDDPAGPLTVLQVSGSKSVVVAVILGAGVLAAIEPVLPLHLTQAFRAGPLTTGLLFGLVVLVGTVFSPIVGALVGKLGARLLIRAGIVMATTALLGLGLSQHYWQLT
ncbi:MAG: MFS transporter, partial [Pseudonocardiales bacterium]|nr:MFS transporter [Pseudonocardiales bacterium]